MKDIMFIALIVLSTFHTTKGILNTTGVRLADGSGLYEGRVEIRVDGVWGTVCDDNFDMNDAKVVCRMLNLTATSFFTGAHFGQGKGPVFVQRFSCYGYESHLRNCNFVPNEYCSHTRDVSVICTECGEINIHNGNVVTVSSNGSILTTACLDGYQGNTNSSVCQSNGSWSDNVTCTTPGYPLSITDIRLVNGIGLTGGTIEIQVNGSWGTICRNNFDYKDAKVICKMLGYNYWIFESYYSFGLSSNPIYMDNLGCLGTENHTNQCLYDVKQSCSDSNPAFVECKFPFNITEVHLVQGTGKFDGIVEVKINDNLGTVCSRYNYDVDAGILCKTMGLNLTHYYTTASVYGQGTGKILLGHLGCSATDTHINQCQLEPPRRSSCRHYYDMSLICTHCGEAVIPHGTFKSFNGTTLTAKCNVGFIPDEIELNCSQNGTWVHNDECKFKYSYPLDIIDLRLVNSYALHEGRVEINVDGVWGTICSTNFTMAEAGVICRMRGLEADQFSSQNPGNRLVVISSLRCNGTESHITNCSYDVGSECSTSHVVTVFCTGYQLNVTGLRLAGTNGPYHGRVELEVNGTWGTICARTFYYYTSPYVICNMLGLEYRHNTYRRDAYYGQGGGPIYIESLYCGSSSYTHINSCKYVSNNYYGLCSHANDLSLMCYGPYLNITDVRLANGTGANDGRAEIKVEDTWGTICDSNFDFRDADVFCNILGQKAVRFFTGATYGEGSGPVYIDQLFCGSSDYKLSDCQYLFLNECSHSRDVSIVCNECGEPENSLWDADYFTYNGSTLYADCSYYKTYLGILKMTCDNETKTWKTEGECQEYGFPLNVTDVRLSGGNASSNGRVEIKSMDTWGTICDHSFGKKEADTICAMIGFPPAVSYLHDAYFGEGSGPIFVDDLECTEESKHINNCSYVTYDNCYHSNDVSVVCTECPSPKPSNGKINSSFTHYLAGVSVECDDGYNMIGDSEILCLLNSTWSSNTICKLIDCGDPTPEYGSVNTTATTNGTVAMVSCEDGFELLGDAIIKCQPSDKWTDNSSCIIKDCGSPDPDNAEVSLTDDKTTFGEIAVISCENGYGPDGSYTVTCLANGTWESWPECKIIECGDPTPNKGSSNTTQYTYGTAAKIECEQGFNISGDSIITCKSDGTWTDNPVCDTSDCGLLAVPNGDVDDSSGTTVGSNVSVTCNKGYKLKGSREVICTEKGWNETVVCEIQDCGNMSVANGEVLLTSEGTLFGDVAEISCNTGYTLNGSHVVTCLYNGKWSNNPQCETIDCGVLKQPNNGSMIASNGTIYNSTISFSCDDEFVLVGSHKTVCETTGEWSKEAPICVAKSPNGGQCISSDYCLLEGSLCEGNICTCKTEVYDIVSKKCDIMPLLPYGDIASDTKLNWKDDCGPRITFNPGIPVFGKTHTSLFVCSHGIISFDNAYSRKHPKNKFQILEDLVGHVVLAPFHAQIRPKQSGGIYFRTYDILNSYSEIITDESVRYIEEIVKKFGEIDKFKPSFALIATWHEVKPKRIQFDKEKKSTFQLVLVTDGSQTFTFYVYGHGQIQWTSVRSKPRVWIGYSVSTSTYYTHPFAYTQKAFQLGDRDSSALSGSDVSGLIFKQLFHTGDIKQNYAVSCINWYNENKDERKYFDYIASQTPECPCDIWLSRFDPWFWQIGLQRHRRDKTHYCVDMLHRGNFGHFGKSCCYDFRTWLWVYQRPLAGSFQLYHPKLQKEHMLNDIEPKENCCSRSNYCNLYYKLRPTGSCYRISPYNFGRFWGDPHFITLDGMNYTFNGIGEYTLLHVSRQKNETFDLQARTDRTKKTDGNLTDATVFTAFAAKDSSNASLHVELNKARNGVNVFANKVDITSLYNAASDRSDESFIYTTLEDNLIITRRDGALSVLFPTSGISLNISVSVQMLSIGTTVPQTLKNATSGLLGNFDGNPYNDLMMPNGSVVNTNSSERQIFEYGKTWEISADNSAFVYDEGKSHKDYQNNSFTPRFLDNVDASIRAQAEQECNGAENTECVIDLLFTENKEVANATKYIKHEADNDRNEISETQPILYGCESANATLGQKVTCPYSFEDGDDVYFIANDADAQINKSTSTIEFTPTNTNPVHIEFAVRNDKGRSSPGVVMNILLCTDCNGRGVCSELERYDGNQTEYFRYAECICEPQYDGPDCENVIDWCLTNPCSLDRECTTLTVEEQLDQDRGYKCADCPEGYLQDTEDVDECLDVDECFENTSHCEHTCVNTEGSYECSCNEGYRVDTKNSSNCIDINECEEALDNCSHLCVNTEGGFSCRCHGGYTVNEDLATCIADNGVCDEASIMECSQTEGCTIDADGNAKCFCERGFELAADGANCHDIDECAQNVCPHHCTNVIGSFTCTCYNGYFLNGLTTCEACDPTHWGENCDYECTCTGRGAHICDPVRGCLCDPGWKGETCDEDINECDAVEDICANPMKECINNLGSYLCQCKQGFQKVNGICEDIDECSSPLLHECMQNCVNVFGGYTCGCLTGYVEINGTSCKDIDECQQGTAECEQHCVNGPGSYNCFCNTGYTLNDDRSSCEKDPCLQLQNLNCSHFCNSEGNDYVCGCRKGFEVSSDKQTCLDVDECNDAKLNLCDEEVSCKNTYGSFTCECPTGTRLANDKRTCLVCDDYHFGKECSQICSCLHGFCDKETGCVCDNGWTGENCNIDVDECAEVLLQCVGANTKCLNTPGSAICTCKNGFTNVSNQCIDKDECLDATMNTCDQVCVNTEGGYTCKCEQGFMMLDGSCSDIDECGVLNECDQICDNTIGSFRCSCHQGFNLNLTERKTCSPISACTEDEKLKCGNNSLCTLQNGQTICSCFKGYVEEDTKCVDLNECNGKPCSQICNNNDGSFTCGCRAGFLLKEDKLTCQDIDECSNTTMNTCDQVCVNTDGGYKCDCDQGYMMIEGSCSDINECLNATMNTCEQICGNTVGGYTCKCEQGYIMVEDSCLDIDECKESSCNQTCTNTDGSFMCGCHDGFSLLEDERTCRDLDECIGNPCSQTCNNTEGSFECICHAGFVLLEDKRTCQDIDECKESPCMQTCDNTGGSFMCDCRDGYSLLEDKHTCQDIDECDEKPCSQHCNNTDGSFTCSCRTGFHLLDDKQSCQDIDECSNATMNTCDQVCKNTDGGYKCECEQGHIMIDGSCSDIDECVETPCSQHCSNTDGSFTCSCRTGFHLLDDKQTCQDIDECSNTTMNTCDQICVNTDGGYKCECEQGYIMIDGSCSDIDECKENPCNQTCNNTDGSYICSCHDGYSLLEDKRTCLDIDECDGKPCSQHCNNTDGSFTCSCRTGFRLLDDKQSCHDIDECSNATMNTCDQVCVNTDGGYKCECEQGYIKIDGSCSDIDECKETVCNQTCNNTDGSFICGCHDGYSLLEDKRTCLDIDECDGKPCSQTCNNTVGGFVCSCRSGFRLKEDNITCQDVDECSDATMNTCDQICVNTNGGYKCKCEQGYMMINGSCLDIDECKEKPCNQTCNNTDGSFVCGCRDGFTLLEDKRTCQNIEECGGKKCSQTCSNTDGIITCGCLSGFLLKEDDLTCQDIDECKENPCNQTCNNTNGSFTCSCHNGYFLLDDKRTCQDVDECTEASMNTCDQVCVNMDGGYKCECEQGYMMIDGSCSECSGNTFGENCSGTCDCIETKSESVDQMCDTVTGECRCKSNWKGPKCVDDVNECEEDKTLCVAKRNATCVNTNGWYKCDCVRGFTANANGLCVEDSSASTDIPQVVGVITLSFSITIHTSVLQGANMESADSYENAKSKVERSLLSFYAGYTGAIIQIYVMDIRIGSIIVDYVVAFDADNDVSSELVVASADLIKGTQITFDGELVNANSEAYKTMEPCRLYSVLIGNCDDGFQCKVTDNVPMCRKDDIDDNALFHTIIIIISAVVGLLLIVGVTLVIIRLRKQKQKKKKLKKRDEQRKRFGNTTRQSFDKRIYDRPSNSNDEEHARDRRLDENDPAWKHVKRANFTDMYRRDESYNQPLHIPRPGYNRGADDAWQRRDESFNSY